MWRPTSTPWKSRNTPSYSFIPRASSQVSMGMCLLAITCCLSKTILQKKKTQFTQTLSYQTISTKHRQSYWNVFSPRQFWGKNQTGFVLIRYGSSKKNGDKIGQILFSRTILNQLILSNLNLSMPYKTGLYKTERQSHAVIFQRNLTKFCPFQDRVKFCLWYWKTKKKSKFINTQRHNSYRLCQILPLKNNTGH